jgi:hypothetical protein
LDFFFEGMPLLLLALLMEEEEEGMAVDAVDAVEAAAAVVVGLQAMEMAVTRRCRAWAAERGGGEHRVGATYAGAKEEESKEVEPGWHAGHSRRGKPM